MPKPAGTIASALMLVACASGDSGRAEAARQSLVGLSRADLLACAGVPDKTGAADDADYFGYVSRSPRPKGSGLSIGLGGFSGNFGGGVGVPLSRPETETCEATFTLRNDRVERVDYRGGRDNAAPLDQCWRIVAQCAGER